MPVQTITYLLHLLAYSVAIWSTSCFSNKLPHLRAFYFLCLECSCQVLSLAVSFSSFRSQPKYPFQKGPFQTTLWWWLPTHCCYPVHFLHCKCHDLPLPCLFTHSLSIIQTTKLEYKFQNNGDFVCLSHGWIHSTWYNHL